MNSKIKNQILEWSRSPLIPNSSCNTQYYNLRFTSDTVKRNLVPNYGDNMYVSKSQGSIQSIIRRSKNRSKYGTE